MKIHKKRRINFLLKGPYIGPQVSQLPQPRALFNRKSNLYRKFWFLGGDFHPDPRSPEGILKIPEGTACCPRGFSKSPNGRWGSGGIPDQKPEFCAYFFHVHNINITKCLQITTYHTHINLHAVDSLYRILHIQKNTQYLLKPY